MSDLASKARVAVSDKSVTDVEVRIKFDSEVMDEDALQAWGNESPLP